MGPARRTGVFDEVAAVAVEYTANDEICDR
jgi:hypothetical protein